MSFDLLNHVRSMDKYTVRGIIYAGFALVGLFLEIFILKKFRTFLLFGYGFIIFIGLVCIFKLKENKEM